MKQTADNVLSLLDEHGARLHALLLRLTLRHDVAEDLMQDLFCKLVASGSFRAADNALAYAIRMATNLALDHRRARRRGIQTGASIDHILAVVAASAPSPIANLMRQEELERVLDALGQLTPADGELIVLRYLERENFETIARHIGKTPHQARAVCHKAIKRLRALVDAERTTRSVPGRSDV